MQQTLVITFISFILLHLTAW